MSRTDKDRPARVRKHDTTLLRRAYHDHLALGKTRVTGRKRDQTYVVHECDIDRMSGPRDYDRVCDWDLVTDVHWSIDRATRIDRRLYWHAPDRARTRSALHDLARSWSGEADELDDSKVPIEQDRSRCGISGGYWW